MLASAAQTWRVHRKLLNPTFNVALLRSYMTVFNAEADTLVERLLRTEAGRARPFNVYDYMWTHSRWTPFVVRTYMYTEPYSNLGVTLKSGTHLKSVCFAICRHHTGDAPQRAREREPGLFRGR